MVMSIASNKGSGASLGWASLTTRARRCETAGIVRRGKGMRGGVNRPHSRRPHFMTKRTTQIGTVLAVSALIGTASLAQTPRTASYGDSHWGFFLMESGAAMNTLLTGQPSLHNQQPEAIITIVSRDGRALGESDRALATGLARGLCEQTGRRFNTQTRGHWLANGSLGFQGACTQW